MTDVVVALLIAVGLVGVLIPFLPGTSLVGLAVAVWAWRTGGATAWVCAGVAIAILVTGVVLKYLYPGRRLQAAGLGARSFLIGGIGGVVGFFVLPVVGLPVGFALGIYLDQLVTVGAGAAWPATLSALRAFGLGMLIELGAGIAAAGVWLIGAVAA